MQILENYNLINLNTFGVPAQARFFVELKTEKDLMELFQTEVFKKNEKFFLGGGSNVLFVKNFEGIIILNNLKGIEISKETEEEVWIRALGGENWQTLVNFTVEKNYWGIENLSLIPGTVGASPIQNIGAYGVELKDVLEEVEAYEVKTGEKRIFKKEECAFGYRESIFKKELKGKYFISAILIRLSKEENKNINYKALLEYLEKNKIEIKSSKDISEAVAAVRKSKLPDPKITGNAGSFFKNVFVEEEKFKELQKKFPGIRFFKETEKIKIPAAWLIEECGFRGKKKGRVGVHEKQALVLVNLGGATGKEVKDLGDEIIEAVYQKFGLKLEREVNIIEK